MKYLGAVFIILALTTALIPQFLDCQSQGKSLTLSGGNTVPMKCHWTARAEIATAASLLAVGVMTVLNRSRSSIQSLSITGIVLGVGVILLPTVLVGVCFTPTMICNTLMLPLLMILGTGSIITGLTGVVLAVKMKGRAYERRTISPL